MEDTSSYNKTRFENSVVQYSRVWEDWELLQQALEVKEHDVILSVTGAGDNTLNLLLEGPQTIVSVDSNPAQSAMLELKLSAIRQLNHSEFLELIGIKPSQQRKDLYHSLNLPVYAKAHWDNNMNQLEAGIAKCGDFDQYLQSIQTTHLPVYLDNEDVDLFLDSKTLEEQRKHFRNWSMQGLSNFMRDTIADDLCTSLSPIRAGWNPPGSELHIDDVTSRLVRRFARVCEDVSVKNNIYLDLFLRSGRVSFQEVEHKQPPYLKPENFEKLKSLVDRVQIATSRLEQVLSKCKSATFTKVNMSNICEVLSEEANNNLFELVADKMFQGGRLVYWTMFDPRSASESLNYRFKSHPDLAKSLSMKDKLFFYHAFYVEEVI